MAGARKRAKQDWDLRPNMKDKPGSQGTLFRAPVSLWKPEADIRALTSSPSFTRGILAAVDFLPSLQGGDSNPRGLKLPAPLIL